MAHEESSTVSNQLELAKAQAWAHADGQAALEAVRWTVERYRAGGTNVLFGKRLIDGVKESAEAYLIAKAVIQGAAESDFTQIEVNTMRDTIGEELRGLIDREVNKLKSRVSAN